MSKSVLPQIVVCGILYGMSTAIPMDKSGRLVLPREFRSRLHLVQGDVFDADLVVDEIRLRPRRAEAAGILHVGRRAVWDAPGTSATAEDVERALRRGREERDARVSGL